MPSGNTTEAAQAYYRYLFSTRLEHVVAPRVDILWTGPFWIAVWAAILILFFYLYATRFQSVHRRHGELYGVASFSGSILERIGRISAFDLVVWPAIALWGLFFVVTHALLGQTY